MRLDKKQKKKFWPVSDLDPNPKLTLGRIRIRDRIRNFCFGSATLLNIVAKYIIKEVLRRENQGLKVYPVDGSYVFSMTGTNF